MIRRVSSVCSLKITKRKTGYNIVYSAYPSGYAPYTDR
jgi:hypothetical protein